jgi:hypothetical protein
MPLFIYISCENDLRCACILTALILVVVQAVTTSKPAPGLVYGQDWFCLAVDPVSLPSPLQLLKFDEKMFS